MNPDITTLDKLKTLFSNGNIGDLTNELNILSPSFPNSAILSNLAGAVAAAKGDMRSAAVAYQRAVDLDPQYYKAMDNLGKLYFELDKTADSRQWFLNSLSIFPRNENALLGLAFIAVGGGDVIEAKRLYREVLNIDSSHKIGLFELATLSLQGKDFLEAEILFEHLIDIDGDNIGCLLNYAATVSALGKTDKAIHLYMKAIELGGDINDYCYSLCASLERSNRLDQLRDFLYETCPINFKNSVLWYLQSAILAYRSGQYKNAVNYLRKISTKELTERVKKKYFSIFGRCAVELSKPALAMQNFSEMNRLALKVGVHELDAHKKSRAVAQSIKTWLNQPLVIERPQVLDAVDRQPVFMIGFPRSGTTLLDTFLRGFDNTIVFEEKQFVNNMIKEAIDLDLLPAKKPLCTLKKDILQNAYWKSVQESTPINFGDKFVIDKLPLNIEYVAFLSHVFDNPKFILSLRHPLDCILSCYFQDFASNASMIRMTSLKSAAEYYAEVMEHWLECIHKLKINYIGIRYEQLVENKTYELKRASEFIGVKQNVDCLDNVELAKQRNIINTPSYSQVSKPLYGNAINRWKAYTEYLDECVEIVTPVAAKLGYNLPKKP